MSEIVMPRLTDSMEEGSIISWLKSDGDEVAVGDELVEIETDKASMVYESDLAGTLAILVPEGETRPIGEPIANVGEGASESDGGVIVSEDSKEPEETRVKASPLARRIASDKGVDLASLTGSGPGGRIIKVDVESAEGSGEAAPAKDPAGKSAPVDSAKGEPEIIELSRTQSLIARRMSESKATVPHFYLRTVIDMDRAVEVRAAFKEKADEGEAVPSLNDFVIKAVAIALKRHPRANAAFRDGRFELYPKVNIGMAVATEDALTVPVIKNADHLSLIEIAEESRRLAARVRDGEVTPPELSGGTFTVSNLGMFGVTGFDAVINPGQAGILSVGEVARRPIVTDAGIGSAHMVEVTLACDHRILYGADGAEFLASFKANLEEPGLLA